MKIELILVGKTQTKYIEEGIKDYLKRLKHYVDFDQVIVPNLKQSVTVEVGKQKEGENIMKKIKKEDYVVLLDERGQNFTSVEFSNFLQKRMNSGMKKLIFVIGGAYGFSPELYERANYQLAFSKMTFTHDMIRLFFIEQLYRGFTIIKNEKYHH
jgi:23S rRNA (pseudouridine1915-N3)-methyltransferase